ncbi:hypothetical protein DL770_003425 [Monosporascus sp. CRB-9-2]|nr:hypothetical protein DL770_003425 [Monosporascus sp. CRB-9-2]
MASSSSESDMSLDPETPLTPMADARASSPLGDRPKEKRRQRLLRGIQRISSSPSLTHIGRPRANTAPYGNRGTLSCISLAPTSPLGQNAPGTSTPGYFPSVPGTPAVEFPEFEGIETRLAPRKVANASMTCLNPGSVSLPQDLAATRPRSGAVRKPHYDFWASMPDEIRIQILSYLRPKELVRVSRVNKYFHKFCFDGQLWTRFDASEFYQEIPAESLAKIIVAAGPFVKDLNLRGCLQIEHHERAEIVAKSCKNLINATLEGCRNLQRTTLHSLIQSNDKLANLNLTSLSAVTNSTCKIISRHCPQLEMLNVSWCKHMDARGIKMVIRGCPKLRDVRAGEIRGFDNLDVAQAIFETNNLERLVLNGCVELNDEALKAMIHGRDPEVDILTNRPIAPPRKLRHLDLSRCSQLTSRGVEALGHFVPELEGLQLNGCRVLTDSALEPILATTPRLTHLELEDLSELTNEILSEHLAKAPCASRLEHLSVSYCENLGDAGMLPVIKKCVGLKSIDMDNTRIGDLVLAEAAAMVRSRAARTSARGSRPRIGLRMVVYDCSMVTWTGVREILSWNAKVRQPSGSKQPTYPTEVIGLKCFYGWQQTVEQHTQRVLRGDFAAAARLEQKWAHYMQAVEEAGAVGAGIRRRRRRAREAQMLHANEEEGGVAAAGRRRARTMAASCSVM